MEHLGLQEGGPVQQYIDSECLRLCAPFVPRRIGTLNESGTIHTQIGSGEVKYSTPYARRWYYMPAHFQDAPQRGNYWFERMKGSTDKALSMVPEGLRAPHITGVQHDNIKISE